MKNLLVIIFAVIFLGFFGCNQTTKNENETILKGKTKVLVDETFKPVIEDQIMIFESKYDASIKLVAKSETEVVMSLVKDTANIAVLSRTLNQKELSIFKNKKITPRITKIATDAIAFISNKKNKDTLIALEDIIAFMKGQPIQNCRGLVFDNFNSSTFRYLKELSGLQEIPKTGVFSFKTNEDVIKFVSENDGMIGVVGVNWLMQPSLKIAKTLKSLTILNVKGVGKKEYFQPTQNNIAEGKYPLVRDLYIINCQGYSGLGMGFASFVAGDIGQRIILKSGLLPEKMPSRNIIIRKGIESEKIK
jgi:phosphate transport system substrate-binding protein